MSSALRLMDFLLIWDNKAFIGLLSKSMSRLGNTVPIGINLIYIKVRLISLLLLKHFLMVYFMTFTHTSTHMLLCWLYDDVMAWSVLSCLQNCLNLFDTNLCLHLKLFSLTVWILWAQHWLSSLHCLLTGHQLSSWWEICCSSLQYTIVYYYL